ncbi:hypothetical protein [Gilliamella sp. App6-5]|nr:hypothetical protein [Gilliamella apicola]
MKSDYKQAKSFYEPKKNSRKGNEDIAWYLYKYCHLVENAFVRMKPY